MRMTVFASRSFASLQLALYSSYVVVFIFFSRSTPTCTVICFRVLRGATVCTVHERWRASTATIFTLFLAFLLRSAAVHVFCEGNNKLHNTQHATIVLCLFILNRTVRAQIAAASELDILRARRDARVLKRDGPNPKKLRARQHHTHHASTSSNGPPLMFWCSSAGFSVAQHQKNTRSNNRRRRTNHRLMP